MTSSSVYYLALVLGTVGMAYTGKVSEVESECSAAMFGGDESAYYACQAQFALQRNWFPSPIAGLYTYQDWNGFYGFWQNGVILETFADFINYGKHKRYRSVIVDSWRPLSALLHAYHPQPSFDDLAWYALSFAKINEVLKNETFLNVAFDTYKWNLKQAWDNSGHCRGGFWFDARKSKKITIVNVLMLLLGARVYRMTGAQFPSLLDQALRTLEFIIGNQILNPNTNLVSDEMDVKTCKANDRNNYTYNSGVLVGGLTELFNITGNATYAVLAQKVANATITHNSRGGVLSEYCDWQNCSKDENAKIFKGIFVRNLRSLIAISDSHHKKYYREWLQGNLVSVMKHGKCHKPITLCEVICLDGPSRYDVTGPVFSTNWYRSFDYSAPMQQTAVLDLLVSNIIRHGL